MEKLELCDKSKGLIEDLSMEVAIDQLDTWIKNCWTEERDPGCGEAPTLLAIAIELRELRQEVARLRLLVEHEEIVRSKKLHRETPVKSNSFLRGSRMSVGDRVFVWGSTSAQGTVKQIDRKRENRMGVQLDGTDAVRWFKMTELRRVQTSVA